MKKKNPFKKLGYPPQEVPNDLKQKVMDNVNSVKLFMELGTLFSNNYVSVVESFFATKQSTRSDKNNIKK